MASTKPKRARKKPQTASFVVTNNDPAGVVEALRDLANMLESGQLKVHSGGMVFAPRSVPCLAPGTFGEAKQGVEVLSTLLLMQS